MNGNPSLSIPKFFIMKSSTLNFVFFVPAKHSGIDMEITYENKACNCYNKDQNTCNRAYLVLSIPIHDTTTKILKDYSFILLQVLAYSIISMMTFNTYSLFFFY